MLTTGMLQDCKQSTIVLAVRIHTAIYYGHGDRSVIPGMQFPGLRRIDIRVRLTHAPVYALPRVVHPPLADEIFIVRHKLRHSTNTIDLGGLNLRGERRQRFRDHPGVRSG